MGLGEADLVLMTTNARKAMEKKQREHSQSIFQFIAPIFRQVKW